MKRRIRFALIILLLSFAAPSQAEDFFALNPQAGSSILYEVQVRTANACRTDTGSDEQRTACGAKVAPKVKYRAFNGDRSRCGALQDLDAIRLGTLEDLLEPTADYRKGITLQYIHDRVGANTVWMMPLFPNNDQYNLPDACDNLGSPYAVRDYFHIQGKLSRDCIAQGRDENSFEDSGSANPGTRVATPTPACYGNVSFDRVIQDAHRRGLKVMLDLA